MNNNSIIINNYLQHEMSAAEKAAFEERLAKDKDLQHELYIQQQVINAVMNAGLKASFAKAIRQKIMIRRSVILGIAAGITAIIFLLYNSGQNSLPNKTTEQTVIQQASNTSKPFINPPLPRADVPVSEYSFDAEKGDTIFYPSGSVIYFPPSALVDASGNLVKGMIRISYREFADPLDFFVSGIPMQYDSAGVKYNFESSGMCEINAYKDNKPVFVNPRAKPQINLSVSNKSAAHNLYFLDTVTRNWNFIGKDIITEVKNITSSKPAPTAPIAENEIPIKPVKPALASDEKQHFSIEIEPGSFQELYAYDKLKFEVVNESTYLRSDAEELWNNVKLDRTPEQGIYNVTFSNGGRKVTYKVRPVLEGEDYAAALKVFNKKNNEYEQLLKTRLVFNQKLADSFAVINKQPDEKMNDDIEWNTKMNALIIARNKKMRELKATKMDPYEKAMAAGSIMSNDQMLLATRNEWKAAVDMAQSGEIIRTFPISNFGIWNCDRPGYPINELPITATYNDSSNNKINLTNVTVIYRRFNGFRQFTSQQQLGVVPGEENMLWSIIDSSFYYFSYQDFKKAGINRSSKAFTFIMRKADKPITSYNDIRGLVEKM